MEFGSAFILSTPINPAVDFEEIDETDYTAGIRSNRQRNMETRGEGMCLLDIIDTYVSRCLSFSLANKVVTG